MVDLVMVVPHLGDGGVQRVTATLANAWSRQGRTIVIVTLYREPSVYAVDPAVRIVSLLDHVRTARLLKTVERLRPLLAPGGRRLRRGAAWVSERTGRVLRAVAARLGWDPREKRSWLLDRIRRATAALGGALALLWPLRAFEVFLLRLPPGHPLSGLWRLYLPALLRVRALRAIVEELRPRVVLGLCGSTNVMTALAGEGLAAPVIISERNDPARQRLEAPWNGFRTQFYDRADLVTANTRGALEAMTPYVDASKLRFIPNPLVRSAAAPSRAVDAAETADAERGTILAVGRLHPQKAHDVLIRALAALGPELGAWRLCVVGQGERALDLRELARQLGVAERIDWTGQVEDPFPLYAAAQVFALPSLHEGTPNALLEAMNSGLAVIVTDASPGPLELVEDERTGLVVRAGDPADLAFAIERLARDPGLRDRLGRAARERVAEYDLPRALRAWEAILGLEARAEGADTAA